MNCTSFVDFLFKFLFYDLVKFKKKKQWKKIEQLILVPFSSLKYIFVSYY